MHFPHDFLYFSATSGPKELSVLSNDAQVDEGIVYKKRVFASVEHAMQSDKFLNAQRYRFSVRGDLGGLSKQTIRLIYNTNDEVSVEKKMLLLSPDGRPPAVGVLAREAARSTNLGRLGLTLKRRLKVESDADILHSSYGVLLRKFSHKRLRTILCGTKSKHLVAFHPVLGARMKQSMESRLYGIVDIEESAIYGDNLNGRILMHVRRDLLKSTSEEGEPVMEKHDA